MSAKAGKRKEREVVPKSAEELELESYLFGDNVTGIVSKPIDSGSVKFTIDKQPTKAPTSAWHDADDDEIEINLDDTDRLKKLKKNNENIVSGTEFGEALKERFAIGQKNWANVPVVDSKVDNDTDLLFRSGSMVVEKGKGAIHADTPLPAGRIDVKRLVNANIAAPSKGAISAVHFHSSGDLMLAGGADKHVRFFKIDGDTNEKQLSVKFDMQVANAQFLGTSSEVVVSGRKPYFYVYDTHSGAMAKVPGPVGRDVKSLEDMTVSPDGEKLAFRGAAGHIHICSGRSKSWLMDVKMNSSAKSIAFLDETSMVSSGLDADIYLWDLRMNGRCVARFPHDDGSCTSSLAAYSPPSTARHDFHSLPSTHFSVGTESGVVSVFEGERSSATGHFDFSAYARAQQLKALAASSSAASSSRAVTPLQTKTLLSLTTKITCSAFHPSGQILAMASSEKKDQLKLVHMPSHSVFSNWPTDRTPFNRIQCLAFSPGGAYLAVGNNRGKVLLYQLNHFGSA